LQMGGHNVAFCFTYMCERVDARDDAGMISSGWTFRRTSTLP
jgi:hypothetical protein